MASICNAAERPKQGCAAREVGKIGLPDTMLRKPLSAMSSDELALYRRHPLNGEAALLEQSKDASGERHVVDSFTDATLALARARECSFALAISDQRMPGMTGVQFLTQLRQMQPDCGRIILSGYADLSALMAAINEAEIARSSPSHGSTSTCSAPCARCCASAS